MNGFFDEKEELYLRVSVQYDDLSYNGYDRSSYFFEGGKQKMKERPIKAVQTLQDYTLRVEFTSGNSVLLNMDRMLPKVRFMELKNPAVWERAETDGLFVRWPGACE